MISSIIYLYFCYNCITNQGGAAEAWWPITHSLWSGFPSDLIFFHSYFFSKENIPLAVFYSLFFSPFFSPKKYILLAVLFSQKIWCSYRFIRNLDDKMISFRSKGQKFESCGMRVCRSVSTNKKRNISCITFRIPTIHVLGKINCPNILHVLFSVSLLNLNLKMNEITLLLNKSMQESHGYSNTLNNTLCVQPRSLQENMPKFLERSVFVSNTKYVTLLRISYQADAQMAPANNSLEPLALHLRW